MIDIIINGCFGKMGKTVAEKASADPKIRIAAGIDLAKLDEYRFPVYRSFDELPEIDTQNAVIIDFSHPSVINNLLRYAVDNRIPAVICTTGISDEDKAHIKEASKSVPVFYSGNMSIGVNLLISLVKIAQRALNEDFDVEIIEKHHNQKIDAPSGTAYMIADAIKSQMQYAEYVYDRHLQRKKREKNEIGIHSVRGGNIVGEHEVIFAGDDEVITIKHQAQSKAVFAKGALSAAKFLIGKEPGMYDMSDLIPQE